MADDITDALRAVIEPVRDELITVAQRHLLERIREEAGDLFQAADRLLNLVGQLVPPDEPETAHSLMTPLEATIREAPRIGETWLFDLNGRGITAEILEDGCTDGIPEIARDQASGQPFKFNATTDPIPTRRINPAAPVDGPPPDEPEGPYTPYTDESPAYQRMAEGTDTL